MRYVLAFALLVGFAAVNLALNLYVPAGVKLLLVPVFSLVVIAVIAGLFHRRHRGSAPPP